MGLTTLEERRVRGDMIEVFKIMHFHDVVNRNTWFSMAGDLNNYRTRLSAGLNISTPKVGHGGEIRKNFFSYRVVENWNDLPEYIKCAASVDHFKNLYDEWKSHRT